MAGPASFPTFMLLLFAACISNGASDRTTLAPEAKELRRLVKRAPTASFIGMRGKKQHELDASSASAGDDNWQQLDAPDIDPLALDYGDESYNENGRREKKAPLAFVGMRGKKYILSSSRLGGLLQSLEQQRYRENLLQNLFDHLAAENENENGDLVKRAPTGFTGMRGKRRREDNAEALEQMAELEKRAPVNSFVGMRGKKDVSHQHYKRAALVEAYDVRGKKQRYADFNSKFVAVRGKKSDEAADELDEQRYLVQPSYPWADYVEKRAPNGFLGMRGKRPALAE